jgi:hypothetical protein
MKKMALLAPLEREFSKILDNVSGIGPVTLVNLQELVTVSTTTAPIAPAKLFVAAPSSNQVQKVEPVIKATESVHAVAAAIAPAAPAEPAFVAGALMPASDHLQWTLPRGAQLHGYCLFWCDPSDPASLMA